MLMALHFEKNCLWFLLVFYLNDNSLHLIFLGQTLCVRFKIACYFISQSIFLFRILFI